MQFESGLFDRIVVQRNRKNVSEAAFSGTTPASGDVLARVTKRGRTVKGFDGVKVGGATGGRFRGVLRGLRVGGPYDVQLSIAGGKEKISVKGILVGDVWLCAGQSNMQGAGRDTPFKSNPLVRAFYMDDHWDTARDPMHHLDIAVDAFHNGGNRAAKPAKNLRGVGPAVSFGYDMLRRTKAPQGLIACAHGGTSMSQWDPALKDQGGKSLYGAMFRRLVKNGGKVAGMIWYQGESDASPEAAPLYTKRMKDLIAAVRRDTGDAALPVAVVQLSRVVNRGWPAVEPWNDIQEQQRLLSEVIPAVAVVPGIDLTLDDPIHISGEGGRVLGRRLAEAMAWLKKVPGAGAGKAPITLRGVKVESDKQTGLANVVVEFANVVGKLTAGSRPTGFAVAENNQYVPLVFDVQLKGNRAVARLSVGSGDLTSKTLHYGLGTDPVCNITDAAGRSLPVFGPVRLSATRALLPCVRHWRVSPVWPLPVGVPNNLTGLQYAAPGALSLEPRQFPDNFANRREELQATIEERMAWFVCHVDCPEAMDLSILLGYDGPVKLWIDGREHFADPKGTNPAIMDGKKVKWPAAAGTHEIVIALSSNRGKAWGVFFRLERNDVTKAQLKQGPEAYKMPTVRTG